MTHVGQRLFITGDKTILRLWLVATLTKDFIVSHQTRLPRAFIEIIHILVLLTISLINKMFYDLHVSIRGMENH